MEDVDAAFNKRVQTGEDGYGQNPTRKNHCCTVETHGVSFTIDINLLSRFLASSMP